MDKLFKKKWYIPFLMADILTSDVELLNVYWLFAFFCEFPKEILREFLNQSTWLRLLDFAKDTSGVVNQPLPLPEGP